MSKTLKAMLSRDYTTRLVGTSEAMVISIRGMKGRDATKFRNGLAKSKVKVTVVRNSLAKRSMAGTALEPLAAVLEGPSALAYGELSVVETARLIVKMLPDFPGMELKGALLDGTLFKGDAGVKELSKFPTKAEAIADAVTLIVSPGRKIAAQIVGPGTTIAGLIKAIEQKLEKNEPIAKQA